MAAKCAFIEKVGAVYYVRKRISRAWNGRVDGEMLRLSFRTKDRTQALKRGLEALAVFEELLSMGPEEALKHLTRQLIDEQLLKPKEMPGDDLVRRRALANVGTKIIRRAREESGLGENLDAIYQELVFLNRATLEGEALYPLRCGTHRDGTNFPKTPGGHSGVPQVPAVHECHDRCCRQNTVLVETGTLESEPHDI